MKTLKLTNENSRNKNTISELMICWTGLTVV